MRDSYTLNLFLQKRNESGQWVEWKVKTGFLAEKKKIGDPYIGRFPWCLTTMGTEEGPHTMTLGN